MTHSFTAHNNYSQITLHTGLIVPVTRIEYTKQTNKRLSDDLVEQHFHTESSLVGTVTVSHIEFAREFAFLRTVVDSKNNILDALYFIDHRYLIFTGMLDNPTYKKYTVERIRKPQRLLPPAKGDKND